MPDRELAEMITEKNRRSIGLLSVIDLDAWMKDMDPTERKHYVSQVAALYELIEQELKAAIAKQIDYAIRHAVTFEEVLICRGSVNMGEVLLEHFASLRAEHINNIKPPEEFDPHQIISS